MIRLQFVVLISCSHATNIAIIGQIYFINGGQSLTPQICLISHLNHINTISSACLHPLAYVFHLNTSSNYFQSLCASISHDMSVDILKANARSNNKNNWRPANPGGYSYMLQCDYVNFWGGNTSYSLQLAPEGNMVCFMLFCTQNFHHLLLCRYPSCNSGNRHNIEE